MNATTALIVFRDRLWNGRAIFLVRDEDGWHIEAEGYEHPVLGARAGDRRSRS